ncbi:MAG TPA: glycosyltransferase family 4 protein [Acidimicrobiia bacterium]|nr:glycosyltransferase family 4 protein [Acidimicrobiia bacterium]
MTPANRRVAMGLLFYPRGGSAQVVRYLAAALSDTGWQPSVYCGSLGPPGAESNAATFFSGLDVHALDYGAAIAAFERGEDPLLADPPLHPSYEERAGAPDPVLAAVDPARLDRQVEGWMRLFERGDADDSALFHLHHLTPQHEAVAERWPDHPVVGHLHGTEMKMLDAIEEGASWPHGAFWADAMRRWARRCRRVIVISPHDRDEAARLLDVEAEWIPNGVDTDHFDIEELTVDQRLELWRRWLVDEPRGWSEGGEAGSVSYRATDVRDRFVDAATNEARTVLLFVGRFLAFKRVPLLVRAYAKARSRFPAPAPLVIWGGSPGEYEGEHPHTVATRAGVADDVFFVGWRGHDELPLGLACADVMVAPSVDEPFGQVFLEAMACGVPVITTATGGPLSFVNTESDRPNGWLVAPDDEDALADAIVEAVTEADERRSRGRNGYEQVRAHYSWFALVKRFTDCYEDALSATGGAGARGAP